MVAVVALDAGTTGVRSFAIDEQGKLLGWAYREFPQYFPKPGWVEHDPLEIWDAASQTLAELSEQLSGQLSGQSPKQQPIAAVGITNQRETAVIWDKRTGLPLERAIVWQDRRTAPHCRQLAGHLELVRSRTGLVLDPYFSATKYSLLVKQCVAQGHDVSNIALGTVDSWLIWQLSGGEVFATDPSNASRTSLFDIHKRVWSDELCDLFEVPKSALPEVLPSSGILCRSPQDANSSTNSRLVTRFRNRSGKMKISDQAVKTAPGWVLPKGVTVSGVAGDQQAALFGQACFAPGDVKNTYGTGSFVLMNTGNQISTSNQTNTSNQPNTSNTAPDGLLASVGWELSGGEIAYVLEGSIFVTGAAVQWLRDGLEVIDKAEELEPLALEASQGSTEASRCVMVPAFAGLGSPWWDADARGAILGLSSSTSLGDLARAVMVSMSYQTADVVRAMEDASGHKLSSLRVDGGAAAMEIMLQHQANVLGVSVIRPKMTESTARGAAWLAGLGAGVWTSTEELADQWESDCEFSPASAGVGAELEQWHKAVQRTRAFTPGSLFETLV